MKKQLDSASKLITVYQNLYREKFGKKQVLNRNKLQYSVANILLDLDEDQVQTLMQFYIRTDKDPSLQKFCFEYDEIDLRMRAEADDRDLRRSLMRETMRSVQEYQGRYSK